mmetsp:Transcript_20349/g.33745  ORF Transcript_20349/g.33745 Transcript_20349/m.33745 type:complete len:87 (-) Transcript_20349:227-487(-)
MPTHLLVMISSSAAFSAAAACRLLFQTVISYPYNFGASLSPVSCQIYFTSASGALQRQSNSHKGAMAQEGSDHVSGGIRCMSEVAF